eukprot:1295374-Karenia_brevis.AAC.1
MFTKGWSGSRPEDLKWGVPNLAGTASLVLLETSWASMWQKMMPFRVKDVAQSCVQYAMECLIVTLTSSSPE